MKLEEILEQIADAGSWLSLTVVRSAFAEQQAVTRALLEAITSRAAAGHGRDIRNHHLATFGIFCLAQLRDRRIVEALVQLFENTNPDAEDEWMFSSRLFFLGHRLLAEACPDGPHRPLELALNPNLKPLTRALAVSAIGLMAVYGDIPRAEAVKLVRQTFKPRGKNGRLPAGPGRPPSCIAASSRGNCSGFWHRGSSPWNPGMILPERCMETRTCSCFRSAHSNPWWISSATSSPRMFAAEKLASSPMARFPASRCF